MYSHGKGIFPEQTMWGFFFYTKLLPLKEKKIEKVNFLVTHYFLTWLRAPVCIFNTKLHYEDISTLWTPKAISDRKVEF